MDTEMTQDQQTLADTMSDLSEEWYCAGWLFDLEFYLWAALLGRPTAGGFERLGEKELERLRYLSRACGGWIVWDEKTWRAWVPLAEWERRFAEWEERVLREEPR